MRPFFLMRGTWFIAMIGKLCELVGVWWLIFINGPLLLALWYLVSVFCHFCLLLDIVHQLVTNKNNTQRSTIEKPTNHNNTDVLDDLMLAGFLLPVFCCHFLFFFVIYGSSYFWMFDCH